MNDFSKRPSFVPADSDLPSGNTQMRGSFETLVESIERSSGGARITGAAYRAGRAVREMRKACGFTQRQLAARIGVNQSRISEIEAGIGPHGPSMEVFSRIAEACGAKVKVVAANAQEYAF